MFRLSDRQLSELVCFLSVPEIQQIFPEYSPTVRTIYRRLSAYGITKPGKVRSDFRKELLLAAPPNVSDRDAELLIDLKIQEMLEEAMARIESEASAYKQRLNR